MPTFSFSMVAVHPEKALECPRQDNGESASRNDCHQSVVDTADENTKIKDSHHSVVAHQPHGRRINVCLRDHHHQTHASLPCLLSDTSPAQSAVCQGYSKSKFLSRNEKCNNGEPKRAQASLKDNRYQQLSSGAPAKMSQKKVPPRPPGVPQTDGKYGWIIVLGAFIVSMIIDGICLSFGIFYSEFLDYFGEGQSKTAWTGSVLSGTYSLLGKQFQ